MGGPDSNCCPPTCLTRLTCRTQGPFKRWSPAGRFCPPHCQTCLSLVPKYGWVAQLLPPEAPEMVRTIYSGISYQVPPLNPGSKIHPDLISHLRFQATESSTSPLRKLLCKHHMAVQKYLSTRYACHPKYPNLNPVEPPVVDFQSRNQSLTPELPSFHKLNSEKSMLALEITPLRRCVLLEQLFSYPLRYIPQVGVSPEAGGVIFILSQGDIMGLLGKI